MAFVTLEQVKTALGIADSVTAVDAAIQLAVDGVNAELLEELSLSQTDPREYTCYADTFRADRRLRTLRIAPCPVISISEVDVAGLLVDSDDYRLRDKNILRFSTAYAIEQEDGIRDIKVVCQAGFATVPANITYGAVLLAGGRYLAGPSYGIKREQIGRYSKERFALGDMGAGPAGDWPPALASAMAGYLPGTNILTATPE